MNEMSDLTIWKKPPSFGLSSRRIFKNEIFELNQGATAIDDDLLILKVLGLDKDIIVKGKISCIDVDVCWYILFKFSADLYKDLNNIISNTSEIAYENGRKSIKAEFKELMS
jgi:hypothetical protein